MSEYIAVLGRQPEISRAELEAVFGDVREKRPGLAVFEAEEAPEIERLGGSLKIGERILGDLGEFLRALPEGKLTIGVSDYSRGASRETAANFALSLKKKLKKQGRSVRVSENQSALLSTATSLHNGLSGRNPRKVEILKVGEEFYRVTGVQDIEAYARRDQARPARDAKVGMLPPKLAQILINLCGELPAGARVLDPFCGTGVVLQEAALMGYRGYGTDLEERMVRFTEKNLKWLEESFGDFKGGFEVEQGDATKFQWSGEVGAVATEAYLGRPFSAIPSEMEVRKEKTYVSGVILGFLKNLGAQIRGGTPVVVAVPAWLRQNRTYLRLEILDEIDKLGYNVSKSTRDGLLYHREGQVVARDIIILRKR